MEEGSESEDVQIYLIALGVEKHQSPVTFQLHSPINKIAYENSSSLLHSLIELGTPTTEKVRLMLKFISKNSVLESLVLDRATDDRDNKSNVRITINTTESRATLTAYKTYEGAEGLWKSVNIYSMVSKSSDANVINSIFGDGEVKYDGCSASNFYPLQIDFTKDFAQTGEILGKFDTIMIGLINIF
ncbi:hypothetical protein C2845_PM01G29650 [Panicum miliaceum]|uniref:Uncharacterized protein n=1 Tax=Panicum miliaceum TaxID=4540 RepID=A0A3L6TP87_PANMI|nr:hypothetical protein C2845_PM01G29650 [Panicum miliaceum]